MVFTSPVLNEEVHLCEVFLYLLGIGSRFVYLVYREDYRHASGDSMVDGLLGLWHNVVIGSDDDDGHVGDLSTTCTHSSESLMSRCIEECDVTPVVKSHVVCTDVLCDATSFTGNDVRLAYVVEQRGLTVVNVSHHSHDGCAWNEVCLVVGFFGDGFTDVSADKLRLESKGICHQVYCLTIHTLVDADHHSDAHALSDDLRHWHAHHGCQLVGRDELSEFEYLGFLFCDFHLMLQSSTDVVAFLATVFSTLAQHLVLAGSESCQCLAHLLCNLFVALLLYDRFLLGLVLALAVLTRILGLLLLMCVAALVLLRRGVLPLLLGNGIDVHTLSAFLLSLALTGSRCSGS